MPIKKTLIAIFVLITFFSCRKSLDTTWDVDITAPIARSTLNLNNFFKDNLFTSDVNGQLHLAFTKDLFKFELDSLVKIPDTTITFEYKWLFGALSFSNNFTFWSKTETFDLDVPNDIKLKKLFLKTGRLKMEFTSSIRQPTQIDYEVPSFTFAGTTFTVSEIIPAGTLTSPGKITKYYSLNGYDVNLAGSSNTATNEVVHKYTIKTAPTASADVLNSGEGVSLKVTFDEIVPQYVQGYFGEETITIGPDSAQLEFLNNFAADNLSIQNASINFNLVNEFGIDCSATINSIKSINKQQNQTIILTNPTLNNILNINRAGKTNNTFSPIFPSVKSIPINTTNSNLKPFLENMPNYLGYELSFKINPLGNVSGYNDFAYYGYGFRVVADVDVPVELSANYFKLLSTSKLDLTKVNELDNINYGDFILQATNGYPFDCVLQGYFYNENNVLLDSLFGTSGGNIIAKGLIDNNNVVTQPVFSKLKASFDRNKLEKIKQCKTIKFVSYFYLPNQPSVVKIYDSYTLDLVLSTDINYKVNTK